MSNEIQNRTSEISSRAVVVSFDRLHSGYLGYCGNDWIETPNLDRLATEGVVFDQHFCENLDPAAANHAWWTGQCQFPLDEDWQRRCRPFVEDLHERGVRTCLILESDGGEDSGVAPPFGEMLTARGSDGFDVAETETPFAAAVQRCGDWLQESRSEDGPALLWIKSRGVPTPWVPPKAFAELYLDEFGLTDEVDEPDSDDAADGGLAERAPPETDSPDPGQDGALDWNYAAAMYAAYVTLIDRWLGRLLTMLRETPGWDQALLIVTAGAGQSLGEHSPIGDEISPLRSECVQAPLLVRIPDSDQGCTRRQSLVQTVDLAPTLLEWFCRADGIRDKPPADPLVGRSLLPLIRNECSATRDLALIGAGRSEWAIRTREFFYVEPGNSPREQDARAAALFEKPHDRWDQSDVLSQYPEVAEELRATLHRLVGNDEIRNQNV